MLNLVSATRFVKVMGSGRTKPCLIECESEDGDKVELVVKYSHNLMEREKNLAIEAIVAMLAADLNLPIPEPFIVELSPDFIDIVADAAVQADLRKSCPLAFGSKLQTGFAVWPTGQMIAKGVTQEAAEIAIFDQIIVNSDRRPENPNCLFLGNALRIIDHELAFGTILFRKQPWEAGGFADLVGREKHIFAEPYFDPAPPKLYDRFVVSWKSITDARFAEYKNAIPPEWIYDGKHIDGILDYLKSCRNEIQTIVENALQVLK